VLDAPRGPVPGRTVESFESSRIYYSSLCLRHQIRKWAAIAESKISQYLSVWRPDIK
jgi:hypothetical protein